MEQSTFIACQQPAKIAGIVPLGRRWGPRAFDRPDPLFSRRFARETPPMRNKIYRLRLIIANAVVVTSAPLLNRQGAISRKEEMIDFNLKAGGAALSRPAPGILNFLRGAS
jgi:hypothetical protein